MRIGKAERNTKETQISLSWNLDGAGSYKGSCGVGFFDHMMQALCVHGGFDIELAMKGDLEVDCHHTVEDVGCSLDVSGRAFLVYDASYENPSVGALDCCMVKEFFRALAFQAGITLHLRVLYGENDHHKIEAIFKAFAHALKEAVTETGKGVLSSKGVL